MLTNNHDAKSNDNHLLPAKFRAYSSSDQTTDHAPDIVDGNDRGDGLGVRDL